MPASLSFYLLAALSGAFGAYAYDVIKSCMVMYRKYRHQPSTVSALPSITKLVVPTPDVPTPDVPMPEVGLDETDDEVVESAPVSIESKGEARQAVERIFPDGRTMNEQAVEAMFSTGTTAQVRAGLDYMDGEAWFNEAPGGLVVAEMIYRVRKLEWATDYQREKVEKKMVEEYQTMALLFKRPDVFGATLLQRAGKLNLWAPASNVTTADHALPDRMLDVIVRSVGKDVLNELIVDPESDDRLGSSSWRLFFAIMQCDPKNYETVLLAFAEAGVSVSAIKCLSFDDRDTQKFPERQLLNAAAKRVGEKASDIAAARARADLLVKANALTPVEAEAAILTDTVDQSTDEVGTAPIARRRARL